jgi:hypothetical protein
MKLLLASIDMVSVQGTNEVVFNPAAFNQQVVNAVTVALAPCLALVLIWITTGWIFRLVKMGSSFRHEDRYDTSDDSCWNAGEGAIYMPTEFSAFADDGAPVVAYGATVDQEASEVTVHSSVGDIRMGRGDYERWMGLVEHDEEQGEEGFWWSPSPKCLWSWRVALAAKGSRSGCGPAGRARQ